MAGIIGLLVLFLATLSLGGCAGMPLDYGNGASGYGYGASCPQPYGGSCAQPYGAYAPVPMPMAPGYAEAGPAVIYAPQPQPYYVPQGDPPAGRWSDQRERYLSARRRQEWRDPREARRQWSEPRHSRGAEDRMSADGNFSPHERGRLNTVPNRGSQDFHGARPGGMSQPGATGLQRGNGPAGPMHPMVRGGAPAGHSGPMNSMGQPQSSGAQAHRGMQPQTRSRQPGVAPRAGGVAEATPGQ